MPEASIFTVGGTVQAGGGIYLARKADDELFEHCLVGNFCYVLTARQMGKSSLMVRTAERLNARDTRTVILDLTRLGTRLRSEQWYLGLVDELVEQLDLEIDYAAWWQSYAHLGNTQRLSRFLREIALEALTPASLVIFIDEIDTTLSLPFADDFFAAIRACYNARGTDPTYRRLAFVLLGVATPGDLIRDPQRTPFNIGQRIELSDFSLMEALPLAEGFDLPPEEARHLLGWVLEWTGGHPYLTQRLCKALVEGAGGVTRSALATISVKESPPPPPSKGGQERGDAISAAPFRDRSASDSCPAFEGGVRGDSSPLPIALIKSKKEHPIPWDKPAIDRIVSNTFFGERSHQDGNLQFVRDMLTRRAPDARKVLETYRRVRMGRRVKNEEQSLVISHLKISGVVREQSGQLALRNLIYERVFDLSWVRDAMPSSTPRRVVWALSGVSLIALLIATYFAYQEWTRPAVERAGLFHACFENTAATPSERMTNLAGLFKLADGAYTDTAQNLFDELTSEQKIDLFKNSPGGSDLLLVARAVYQGLYINSKPKPQNEDDLLRAIGAAVKGVDPALAEEIGYWLEGRLALDNQDSYKAINALQFALAKNERNPAIWVDLARAQIGVGNESAYANALRALERATQVDIQKMYMSAVSQQLSTTSPFGKYWQTHRAEYPALVALFEIPVAFIPGRPFQMGSNQYDWAKPIHMVTLSPFWIDVYEVTNFHYAECVNAGKCQPPDPAASYTRRSYYNDGRYANYPVQYVSWNDAQTYCEWRGARLPTEAEWEKAARGGLEGKLYPWGDLDPVCMPGAANGAQFYGCPIQDISMAGRFAPNGYGLFDMAGNAWEWTADWYDSNYYSLSPNSNPTGPADGQYKVLRGGGWYNLIDLLRVATRATLNPAYRDNFIGFRCAVTPEN
jgi:formylglycine-generating enzyme required for sulfatase activity